jgi:hypothetical protein
MDDVLYSLLFGTNPSAQEIIVSYPAPTDHLTGTHAIQTGGGSFLDIFANRSFFIDAGSCYDA